MLQTAGIIFVYDKDFKFNAVHASSECRVNHTPINVLFN